MKKHLLLGAVVMFGVLINGGRAKTDEAPNQGKDMSHEVVATAAAIKDVALRGSPIAVWETLEHGERLECLECIGYVKPLLFDKDARVREIAAWWLRRRVFGYAAVALEIRKVVESDPDPKRRAAGVEALGEFLDPGGTKFVVKAAGDPVPEVRVAAMHAIQRLNDSDGKGAVSLGLADGDTGVKKAALGTATKLGGFADVPAVAKLLSDGDPVVRGLAADALGVFKATGSVAGLAAIATADPDEDVRVDAINALGEIGDPGGRTAIEKALNDAAPRVRDAARVAQLKLSL